MSEFDEINKYNFIFSQIVENVDDFVGSMAYVLYKRNKIEYIEQYRKENGKEPELEELREWQKAECVKSKLDNYKKLATQKTNEFINILQGEKEKQLNKQKSDLKRKEEEIKERERQVNDKEKDLKKRNRYCQVKQKGQFWLGILQSVIASFIFLVLCIILLLCLKGNTDIVAWLKGLFEM